MVPPQWKIAFEMAIAELKYPKELRRKLVSLIYEEFVWIYDTPEDKKAYLSLFEIWFFLLLNMYSPKLSGEKKIKLPTTNTGLIFSKDKIAVEKLTT